MISVFEFMQSSKAKSGVYIIKCGDSECSEESCPFRPDRLRKELQTRQAIEMIICRAAGIMRYVPRTDFLYCNIAMPAGDIV